MMAETPVRLGLSGCHAGNVEGIVSSRIEAPLGRAIVFAQSPITDTPSTTIGSRQRVYGCFARRRWFAECSKTQIGRHFGGVFVFDGDDAE